MKVFKEVFPAQLNFSDEQIAREYLTSRELVAIRRDLAEELAKCDGGAGSHLMAYDAADDCYVWRIKVVKG